MNANERDNHHAHHHHGPGCKCGCNEPGAEDIIQDALIVSERIEVPVNPAQPADRLREAAFGKIAAIAEAIAVEGAVLGHVKALIQCPAGKASISITRVDSPDITLQEGWEGERAIEAYTLSVSLLSLANVEAPVKQMLERAFPHA